MSPTKVTARQLAEELTARATGRLTVSWQQIDELVERKLNARSIMQPDETVDEMLSRYLGVHAEMAEFFAEVSGDDDVVVSTPEAAEVSEKVLVADEETAVDVVSSTKTATKPSTPRVRRGEAIRKQRDDRRAPRNRRIVPGDKKTLEEVQAWIDEQRKPLPTDFKPTITKKGKEKGEIGYKTPQGWVFVPAAEYAKMLNGTLRWRRAQPSLTAKRKYASKLAGLSFQSSDCGICKKPIEQGAGPEMAQIHQLLNGTFVLPYLNYGLRPNQSELRFRQNHLVCSLWEVHIADIMLADENLAERLSELVEMVTKEAQQKDPSKTEDDVMQSLDDVLAYIDGV